VSDLFSWNSGGSGAFSDPSRWTDQTDPSKTGFAVPGTNDIADFPAGGTVSGSGNVAQMTTESTVSITATISAIDIINSGNITLSSGSLSTTGELRDTGTLAVNSGATLVAAATSANLANIKVDTGGQLSLDGAGTGLTTSMGGVVVGDTGAGTLAMANSATASLSSSDGAWASLILGQNAGATGTMTMSGGANLSTTLGGINIGDGGTGSLALSGGATAIVNAGDTHSSSIIVGRFAGATGTLTLAGGTTRLTTTGGMNVGDGGTGTVGISGGATLSATSSSPATGEAIDVGGPHGGTGTLTVSDTHSVLAANAGGMSLGYNGDGQVTVRNGATLQVNDANIGLDIASLAGATGLLTVTGTGSTLTDTGGVQVGDGGDGTLEALAGATLSVDQDLQIALQAGSTGTVTINAATLDADTGAVVVGVQGDGTLEVQGNGTLSSTAGFVGADDGGTGTVDINTGTWTVGDVLDISVVEGGKGTVTVSGASVLEIGATLTAGDGDTATLEVKDGAYATADTLIVAAQATSGTADDPTTVTVDGDGSVLIVLADATVDTALPTATNSEGKPNGTCGDWSYTASGVGQIVASGGGYISIGTTLTLQAPDDPPLPVLVVESGGGVEVGGATGLLADTLLVDPTGLVVGHGTIEVGNEVGSSFQNGTVADNGVIEAQYGTLDIEGDLSGAGIAQIDDNATLELDGAVADSDTVTFGGGYETTLALDDVASFSGTITAFQQGDVIDLPDVGRIPPSDLITAKYSDGELSLRTVGSIPIVGTDPYPTFGLKSDGASGTDIESTTVKTLLDLSFDTYSATPAGADDYSVIGSETLANGFRAVAYMDKDAPDCDPNIVIAFRGTNLSAIKNLLSDASFLKGEPNGILRAYVKAAADFVASVQASNPKALITLTGHSLGGALAQLVGEASGLAAAGFDAPGAGQLYDQLTSELSAASNLGWGGTNINYRISGDQVSLAGASIGQVVTVASPYTPDDAPPAAVLANFINNHGVGNGGYQYAFQNLQTPSAYTEGFSGPDDLSLMQAAIQGPVQNPLKFLIDVSTGVANILDPPSGTGFVFTEAAGSPNFASIDLTFQPGVSDYNVRYEIGSSWSAFQPVAPGVQYTLPSGVDGVEFDPLDASGNPVVVPAGFLLSATFASSGTFSGTLTVTGAQPIAQPLTTPITLTVAENAAASAIDIPTPTDAAFSDPTALEAEVTALPSDGTVYLADDTTPVTLDEGLTIAQLTGLTFAPTPDVAGQSSELDYSVTDPDLASAVGVATLEIACFLAGTRIATSRGEAAVEALREGDLVRTASGALRPVRWIGHRRIDLARHPDPPSVQPIRIRAGAFADGVPHRDLLVSPDHAIFVGGVLIPVRLLRNDATIRSDASAASVRYFHVELDAHDILLAEGLPAESYLDTGNRVMFANAGVPMLLHPRMDARAARDAGSCAELACDEARVAPVWRRLAARAEALGFTLASAETTADPALRLIAGSKQYTPIRCAGGRCLFVLPPTDGPVRLVSRSAVPAALLPWLDDRRRLGVMIRRMVVQTATERTEIAMDDPLLAVGWRDVERDGADMGRWTDGDATLPVPAGTVAIEMLVGGTLAYPVAKDASRDVPLAA